MAHITAVERNSPARRAGLRAGDDVLLLNGRPLSDALDLAFAESGERVEISYRRKGKTRAAVVEKEADVSLGADFGDALDLEPARCANRCVFCFVDQLPAGMRKTLYVKDDDYRLSLACGSYVTFTNMSEADLARITEMKISPLYVSVHAFGDVRAELTRNRRAADLEGLMRRLADAGIAFHTQIVLCEGLNDGPVLRDTLDRLLALRPAVRSVAVVPVGLTGHREGLFPLRPLTDGCLNDTMDMVESLDAPEGWCMCSDEFYLRTGRKFPPRSAYGSLPQIENGVGLVPDFLESFAGSLPGPEEGKADGGGRRILLVTGESFAPVLEGAAEALRGRVDNAEIGVCAVRNLFFGGGVSVAGLLTGRDLIGQVSKGMDRYIIPGEMLRETEDEFLDGVTLAELEGALGGEIRVCRGNGGDLYTAVTE